MKLQQYELQTILGVGKYGKVTKAWDKLNNRLVAIKEVIIEKENEGIPITTLREIVLLRGITHKNVVELFDSIVDSENNRIYMVLEFLDSDLFVFITQNPIIPKTIIKVKLTENIL